MKRQLFITAIGAAALAGCGGHGMTPHLASSGGPGGTTAPTGALTLIPSVPDPIPANVLAHPILGEARRFVGAAAPDGWLFMDGRALRIDQNPSLFSILGHPPLDKATDTFALPNPGYGVIVAATGAIPTSPQALAGMRDFSLQSSLGPNARPAPQKLPKPESKDARETRELLASAIVPRGGSPIELGSDVSAAMDRARLGAYDDAVGAITPRAAVLVRDAVAAAVAGRMTVYGAVTQVAGQIGLQDALAALAINDRMQRSFSASPAAHANPQREAAQFLITNAITPDQASAIADRE